MADDSENSGQARRRVTAKMVADAAGVSRSAVSRAFTEGAYLDAEKRRKIHEIASQLGYQPNALAAGLQGGRSHLVAIFVGNMRSPYDTEFVSRLVGRLNGLQKWPILIDGGGEQAETAIEKVMSYPLDALILRGGGMAEHIVARCAQIGIPMISSGRLVEAPGVDNVCCRNADGTYAAVRFLLERGRRKFGFLAGPTGFHSSSGRREGVLRALRDAGVTLQVETAGDFTVEGGHATARSLLEQHQLDTLICANDAMAIGSLWAARDLGIAVPEDLSVIGFDDIAMARWPGVNLTTIHNPIGASIDAILDLLDHRLTNPTSPARTVWIDPYLVPRETH